MNLLPHFKGHTIINLENHFRFMRFSKPAIALSFMMMAASLLCWATLGLNFGVDFKGGTMIEVQSVAEKADVAELRAKTGALGLGDVQVTSFGSPRDVLIRVEQQPGGDAAQQAVVGKVTAAIGSGYQQRRVEVVGPAVSSELRQTGLIAVICSILAIVIYVWFRFEWQFALGTVVALVHDVLITVGVFSLLQLAFDLSTVAALLTILGYSVNDTVVVSDRIRENLRKFKRMPLNDLLDLSINETLSRTVMTSLTTMIVLIALFFFGGEVIRDFSFAMLFGIVVGTYSSIFIAAPILQFFGIKRDWSGVTKGAPAPAK